MNHSARYRATRPRGLTLRLILVCCSLLVLPACGIPSLRKAEPGPLLPENYYGKTSAENVSNVSIEEFFNDQTLVSLIDQALVGNQELKILAQDIQIASNEVLSRRGAYLPMLGLGGGIATDKPSLYTRAGAVDNQLFILPGQRIPSPLPDYLVATNLTWQVDIWRQLRNARDAAALRYLGTSEGRNYVVTRLVAEIAENYFNLMALDKRLENINRIIELQEQSLEFAKARKEFARETELAVQRFQAEVSKNMSEKLIVKQDIIQAENRINFLVGRYPAPIERMSSEFFDMNLHDLTVGVPSELLRNRPDIRQAERELEAAGLDIKVARARFYPALVLTGSVGYEAFNPRYLAITPEALVGNIVGELVAPLINKRAIQADYMSANSRQIQAVIEYQRVILNAFIEVINQITKEENYRKSIEIKKEQIKSLESSVESATKLFQNARVEYMDVLFAQRDLLDARRILIETKQEQLSATVYAYQALGGGGYLSPILDPAVLQHNNHRWITGFRGDELVH